MTNPPTLIIGFGNPDRQDDGVAWHVLVRLAEHFHLARPEDGEYEFFPTGSNPDLLFTLQLTPELAETIAAYRRVCFIDAHTGDIAEELHTEKLASRFQASPLTHHLTPQTLLSLVSTLYRQEPEAILVSLRGYEFEFTHELSAQTGELVSLAVERVVDWWQQTSTIP